VLGPRGSVGGRIRTVLAVMIALISQAATAQPYLFSGSPNDPDSAGAWILALTAWVLFWVAVLFFVRREHRPSHR
jgi:hypothetical protein